MDKLTDLLLQAERALATLKRVVGVTDADDVTQDAAVQRFEYSFEALWKATQQYARQEGAEIGSPKGTIRHARALGIFSDGDTVYALRLLDLRNRTTHTYNETLARALYPELPEIAAFFGRWHAALAAISQSASDGSQSP